MEKAGVVCKIFIEEKVFEQALKDSLRIMWEDERSKDKTGEVATG